MLYRILCLAIVVICIPASLAITTDACAQDDAPEELADVDIGLAVETTLILDDAVPSHKIDVSAENGVVTLTGTVEDWDELQAAKENAGEGGAQSVISNLKIENGNGAG